MSNEEAIKELQQIKEAMEVSCAMRASRTGNMKYPKEFEAIDEAIEALKFQEEYKKKLSEEYQKGYDKGYDQAEQNEYDHVQVRRMRLINADECPCITCTDERNSHCTYEHRSCDKFCRWVNTVIYDFEKVVEQLEERTSFLSDCTKYDNKDAEQQRKSYDTMMMYEVADLAEDLVEIVKAGGMNETN